MFHALLSNKMLTRSSARALASTRTKQAGRVVLIGLRFSSTSASSTAAVEPLFDKLLVANRGEIACRIIRTARRLGIRTVAVYGEADGAAQHVAMADEALCIGPSSPKESYLLIERVMEAAARSGAQALHPGYGFLSENPDLARACAAAGVTWVGPPASAIESMGSKAVAKEIMSKAGVHVTPAYFGEDQSAGRFLSEAARIGYPVMLKAVKGGGGKGMRIVRSAEELPSSLESCQREAAASFGSSAVLVEKYIANPRHIEFQVFGDSKGQAVHLWERDCSVQRRHQKVLEEAPAPGMTAELRARMGEAAVAAARAVGYTGAGTVEFMLQPHGGVPPTAPLHPGNADYFFMEMNTRLQVEHPVTEMVSGLDLVEWQLRIAAGQALPISSQAEINGRMAGHALEARVYAENPYKDFLPATGTLKHLRAPAGLSAAGSAAGGGALAIPGYSSASSRPTPASVVRVDTGVRQGDSVTVHYDPMVSKLICWGASRDDAIRGLRDALGRYQLSGLPNNLAFLHAVLGHPVFARGGVDTSFLGQHLQECLPAPAHAPPQAVALAALVHAALAGAVPVVDSDAGRGSAGTGCAGPWAGLPGVRPGAPSSAGMTFAFQDAAAAAAPTTEPPVTAGGKDSKTASKPPPLPSPAAAVVQPSSDGSGTFSLSVGGTRLQAARIKVTAVSHAAALASAVPGYETTTRGRTVAGTEAYEVQAQVTWVPHAQAAPPVTATLHATVVIIQDAAGGSESTVYLPSLPASLAPRVPCVSDLPTYRLLLPAPAFGGKGGAGGGKKDNSVMAPMPGKVVKLLVGKGDTVAPGQALAVLEAMKMEHVLRAPGLAGSGASSLRVSKLPYAPGEFVEEGREIVGLEPMVEGGEGKK